MALSRGRGSFVASSSSISHHSVSPPRSFATASHRPGYHPPHRHHPIATPVHADPPHTPYPNFSSPLLPFPMASFFKKKAGGRSDNEKAGAYERDNSRLVQQSSAGRSHASSGNSFAPNPAFIRLLRFVL